MAKRKSNTANVDNDDEGSDSSAGKIINFDFDFFDLNPDVDYLGIKTLLKQLFDADAVHFDLSQLTDLVLNNRGGASTVKTDGEESDPFAFLALLDVNAHKDHPSLIALSQYILQKSSQICAHHVQQIVSQDTQHLGLIFSERFRNMPVEIIPPLYRMLLDELKNPSYQNISHFLILSRTFHLTPKEQSFYIQPSKSVPPSAKRHKRPPAQPTPSALSDGLYTFHPEDDTIKLFSQFCVDYSFDTAKNMGERNDESFGLDTRGRFFLVERSQFEEMVGRLSEVYAPPA